MQSMVFPTSTMPWILIENKVKSINQLISFAFLDSQCWCYVIVGGKTRLSCIFIVVIDSKKRSMVIGIILREKATFT